MRDDDFDRHQMQGLLSVVDSYISLHRAEGLGLLMAESMYLGKPVIATGYSGNMVFMNTQNSCLVSYELIPVAKGGYIESEGQYWAEPNIEEAASYMMKIFSDESFRSSLKKSAALYIRENHSFRKMGEAIQNRLQELEDKFNFQQAGLG
jgi:glycosyltransferase involved in cell wall biosynthesis